MVKIPELRHYLEQERQQYSATRQNLAQNAAPPEITCKGKNVMISFTIADFSKGDVVECLETLKKYFRDFVKFDIQPYKEYTVTVDLRYEHQREFDHTYGFGKKKKDRQNQMDVSFDLRHFTNDGLDTGKFQDTEIKFVKEAEYTETELQCIMQIWKQYAFQKTAEDNDSPASPSAASPPRSILEKLSDLGALVYQEHSGYTWDSLAGYEAIKQQVKDIIVLPYAQREIYQKIHELSSKSAGSLIPRAVLFEGPPGTGKTTLARILAQEIGYPLIYVPVESIMSCWYGVAEKRLGAIFDTANKLERSILFIDEIDSLAGSRDKEMHEATRRILSVLLRKMQGLVSAEKVLTIGATNRSADLDAALLSRFTQKIHFPLPEARERTAIFHYYAQHLLEADLSTLADHTEQKSGRDIESICAEAERLWAQRVVASGGEVQPPPALVYLEVLKPKKG